MSPLPIPGREVTLGYPRNYTYNCWQASQRRSQVHQHELTRQSLVGNTFDPRVVAWLISHLLTQWGYLSRPAEVDEVADPWRATSLQLRGTPGASQGDGPEEALALVRFYLSRGSLRGGDVKAVGEHTLAKVAIPNSIDAGEWKWRVAISCPWRLTGEHINVLECRAYLLSLRWRPRNVAVNGTRFLHLLDSQVTMMICIKGRTSSRRLRRVLSKINAYVLAGHASPSLGYVRSHLNPADRPSRFTQLKSRPQPAAVSPKAMPQTKSCAAKRRRRGE